MFIEHLYESSSSKTVKTGCLTICKTAAHILKNVKGGWLLLPGGMTAGCPKPKIHEVFSNPADSSCPIKRIGNHGLFTTRCEFRCLHYTLPFTRGSF